MAKYDDRARDNPSRFGGTLTDVLRLAQLSGSVRAGRRGTNSLQLAEPRITPRTNLHPPRASGGNMYLQRSQRISGVGAGP
jgi:hypothetical protein